MSYYDDASLMFLAGGGAQKDGTAYSVKPTDGTGDFTFSRGSNLAATRVGAGPNYYIEKGRENLLLQSNNFDTTWTTSGTSVTSGQSGYDGLNNAWLLTKTGASFNYINQSISQSGVKTFSVYAKAGTLNGFTLLNLGSGNPVATFDLSNGTLASSPTLTIEAKIEAVGNGWYRCSITNDKAITQVRIYPVTPPDIYSDNGNILIQDAQLEQGLVATDVIESGATRGTAGILEDTPRFNYSNGASCPSLLLEPSRTQFIGQSEYFGGWTEYQSSVNLTNQISPDGEKNVYEIIENTTNNPHIIRYSHSFVANISYTISAFLKANTRNKSLLALGGATLGVPSIEYRSGLFNLSNGTIERGPTNGNATIEDYGNGWYRCSVTITPLGSAIANVDIFIAKDNGDFAYQGDGTSGIYIYGAMLESNASYPTSYIPNHSGGTITRAADVCGGAGNSSTFNSTEGVLYAEVSFARNKGESSPFKVDRFTLSDGTANNRVLISNTLTDNQIIAFIKNSSGTIFNETITITDITANNKIAVRYESGNYALYINGVKEATGTSTNVPSGLNDLMFDGPSGNYAFEGKVKQILVFNTALSDADLATLTTI